MRDYMLRRYHERMDAARDEFGGKCMVCGSAEDLHFHHVDPTNKESTVAKMWSLSEARFRAELAKCVLICSTCHKAEHRTAHPHGDVRRFWQGCTCASCCEAGRVHHRAWRAKRKAAAIPSGA